MEELVTSTVEQTQLHDILKDDSIDELETYVIDVRNMNLFSLDTTTRKGFRL